jgi:hypothetical protein
MSAEPSVKSPTNKRKNSRVTFSRGVSVEIVAIDGTWATSCTMLDVAQSGAKLRVDGAVEKLKSKEFFLLLSTTGSVYRRCELAWLHGDQIGVHFLMKDEEKKRPTVRERGVALLC